MQQRHLITEDRTVVHAFDTDIEARLLDRLQLDYFLRNRDIQLRVVDGTVSVSGEVWTPLEKARVSEIIRAVPGVVDVANELDIHPPH
jgi:osmotically-inducible protein OsmY